MSTLLTTFFLSHIFNLYSHTGNAQFIYTWVCVCHKVMFKLSFLFGTLQMRYFNGNVFYSQLYGDMKVDFNQHIHLYKYIMIRAAVY